MGLHAHVPSISPCVAMACSECAPAMLNFLSSQPPLWVPPAPRCFVTASEIVFVAVPCEALLHCHRTA